MKETGDINESKAITNTLELKNDNDNNDNNNNGVPAASMFFDVHKIQGVSTMNSSKYVYNFIIVLVIATVYPFRGCRY